MKILIIKTGALGDVLRSNFMAPALKHKYRLDYPEIYLITSEKAKPLFLNNPYVDNIISVENKMNINKLRELSFDLIINLEEDRENCQFVSSLRTKKLIGVFLNKSGEIDYTPEAEYWFNMSMISKFKKKKADILKIKNKKTHRQILSEMIGISDYRKYEPFLRLTPKQRELSNDFLRRHNLSRFDLILGINTGSADRWPKDLSVKETAKLIDKIYKEFNAKILLFGGPNEIKRNMDILRLTKSPVIITGCGNDLVEFPALISVCNLFITTDTLGLHVALALKRRTIVLMGPTSSSEIDMYERGKKIVAKSKCLCCYRRDCKSMNKINLEEIMDKIKKFLKQKITLIITAFKEPNVTKAIESALNQNTNFEYEVIVAAPDKETLDIVKTYSKKNKKVKTIKDPGKGKSYALNKVFSEIKTDILILTDGDLYISENSVEEIAKLFLDPEIGCVSGRPVPQESRDTKYGYWANFLFDSAHKIRKEAFNNNNFIECTGYLFAFRKDHINSIPLNVAEDTIIPYFFWEKGYKIGYAENAQAFVKNADNIQDWLKQKIRTHKSHGALSRYVDVLTTPKVKSFKTESKGVFWLLKDISNLRESFWALQLVLFRFFTWKKYFLDTHIFDRHYKDAWERIKSTK